MTRILRTCARSSTTTRKTPPAWVRALIANTSRATKASSLTPRPCNAATFVFTPKAAPKAPLTNTLKSKSMEGQWNENHRSSIGSLRHKQPAISLSQGCITILRLFVRGTKDNLAMILWGRREHCEQSRRPNDVASVRRNGDCANLGVRPNTKLSSRQSNRRGWRLRPMKTESKPCGRFTKNRVKLGIGQASRPHCLHLFLKGIRITSREQIND